VSMMRLFSHAIAPRGPIDRIEDEVCVSSLAQRTERGIPMERRLWNTRRVRAHEWTHGRPNREGRRLMTRPVPGRYQAGV
jgi:hypothetical protein